jgi:hypothetical protein
MGCGFRQLGGMSCGPPKGEENAPGLGGFDQRRKGWPGGQPRIGGSALLRFCAQFDWCCRPTEAAFHSFADYCTNLIDAGRRG